MYEVGGGWEAKFSIINLQFKPDIIRLRVPPTKESVFNEFSTSPKGECRKMSAELNSMIDDRSSSTYADARGSEPMAGDESEGPMTQISLEVKSVFGSSVDECAAFGAGYIHPSSEGTTCSGMKSGALAGAMFRILSDCRSKSSMP